VPGHLIITHYTDSCNLLKEVVNFINSEVYELTMAQYDDEYEDPVKNPTKRLAAVLGKDLTGRILGVLIREQYLSASEIAGILNIHIATAQKYLLEMKDAGLVDCRTRRSPTRPTEEYWLAKKKVRIEVDLKPQRTSSDMEKIANSIMIHLNDDVKVAYDTDDNRKTVSEILVLKEDKPSVSKRIKLDNVEGRFAWQLATSKSPSRTVMDVVKKAKLNKSNLPQILKLVDKLSNIGYVGASKEETDKNKE
jgi:predicted transcriptional regulator